MDEVVSGGAQRPVSIADLHPFVLDDASAIQSALFETVILARPELATRWTAESFPKIFPAVIEHLPDESSSVRLHNRLVAEEYGCAALDVTVRPLLRIRLLDTVREVLAWDANELLIARCAAAFDAICVLMDEVEPALLTPSAPAHR